MTASAQGDRDFRDFAQLRVGNLKLPFPEVRGKALNLAAEPDHQYRLS
jgi:hypothetical protein